MIERVVKSLIGASLAIASAGSATFGQQAPVVNECPAASIGEFRSISQNQVDQIIKDVASSNPKSLERFKNDPEARKGQLESIRQLLAFASQSIKLGQANDKVNCQELRNIREETEAAVYDKHVNKGKPAKGPFGYLEPARVSSFWGKGPAAATVSSRVLEEREARFQNFLESKKAILSRDNPNATDLDLGEDEISMARDQFARIQIYASDLKLNSATLPAGLKDQIALQVKLQQAQFLARLYANSAARSSAASDEEIAAFLSGHPELSDSAKREKAEQILKRAKGGEDFGRLANEFTQDPGNTDANGVKRGGLYSDVGRGQFVAPFEKAALALEAGQIYPTLVESDFGFHIIKLERKDASEGGTYDARHILISTTVPDPDNPGGREMPVREYAKSQIESEKERKLIDDVVAANGITVPADFSIPTAAAPKPKTPARRTAKRPVRKRT